MNLISDRSGTERQRYPVRAHSPNRAHADRISTAGQCLEHPSGGPDRPGGDAAAGPRCRAGPAAACGSRRAGLGVREPLGQHGAGGAQPVHETQLECACPGPHLAVEQLGVAGGQPVAAALAHPVARTARAAGPAESAATSTSSARSGRNGSRRRLRPARGVEPPFDTEPFDQAVQPEALADHADRPDQRRRVRVDLVGGAGEPVPAGGGDVLAEREHRHARARRPGRGSGHRPARTAWPTRPAS